MPFCCFWFDWNQAAVFLVGLLFGAAYLVGFWIRTYFFSGLSIMAFF